MITSFIAFSQENCVAICAVLIPVNFVLLALSLLSALRFPQMWFWLVSAWGLAALALLLHVWSWVTIGMIMPITYFLVGLVLVGLTLQLGTYVFKIRSERRNILGVMESRSA